MYASVYSCCASISYNSSLNHALFWHIKTVSPNLSIVLPKVAYLSQVSEVNRLNVQWNGDAKRSFTIVNSKLAILSKDTSEAISKRIFNSGVLKAQ